MSPRDCDAWDDSFLLGSDIGRAQEPPKGPPEPPERLSSVSDNGSKGSREDHDGSWVAATAVGIDDGSREDDWTRARATALGIDAPLGQEFRCVLPGHDDRAVLHPSGRGYWRYRCGVWTGGLGEVRASIAYGRPRRCGEHDDALGQTEVARWLERLDHEAGLRACRPVHHELPPGLSPVAVAVARGALLLLGLRDERWQGQGFVYARRFVGAWIGLSEDAARSGLGELVDTGFLAVIGTQRRAYLYQLGPGRVEAVSPDATSEHALVDRVAEAFDAEEVGAAEVPSGAICWTIGGAG